MYNTIEWQLGSITTGSENIHSFFSGDKPDQGQVNGLIALLASELNRLTQIVQKIATKQRIMSDEWVTKY